MKVLDKHRYNFAYVLPDLPGKPIRIVVPSALQMGWAQSPAYFCTATQAGVDVMEELFSSPANVPAHILESYLHPSEDITWAATTAHLL